MKQSESCYIPNSSSNDNKHEIVFVDISKSNNLNCKDKVGNKRRIRWNEAPRLRQALGKTLKNVKANSRRSISGLPSKRKSISNSKAKNAGLRENVKNIIKSLPEVEIEFDQPEYVIWAHRHINYLDKFDFIQPKCDSNGYYINDHDYLSIFNPNLSTHLREEHNYAILKEPACGFFDARNFCNICSQDFADSFKFNNHLMKHTIHNDIICYICAQTFLTTSCLHNHLATHTQLCDKCGKETPMAQMALHRLINLQQKYQLEHIAKYRVFVSDKIYFCILCMKKFDNEKNYRDHLETKHITYRY